MPTNYAPPVGIGPYRPGGGAQFGMVAFYFDELMESIAIKKTNINTAAIMDEELRAFGKDIIEPTFQMFSPYKPGGSANSLQEWQDTFEHLRDSLRTEMVGGTLILRMRQHGVYTVRGNGDGRILPVRGRNIRIELPGGSVIYRRSVGPIGKDVLQWAPRAWAYIKQHEYQKPLEQRIILRVLAALFNQDTGKLPEQAVFREQYSGVGPHRGPGGAPSLSLHEARKHLSEMKRQHYQFVKKGQRAALHQTRIQRYRTHYTYHAHKYNVTGNLEHKRAANYYKSLFLHEHKQYGNLVRRKQA